MYINVLPKQQIWGEKIRLLFFWTIRKNFTSPFLPLNIYFRDVNSKLQNNSEKFQFQNNSKKIPLACLLTCSKKQQEPFFSSQICCFRRTIRTLMYILRRLWHSFVLCPHRAIKKPLEIVQLLMTLNFACHAVVH